MKRILTKLCSIALPLLLTIVCFSGCMLQKSTELSLREVGLDNTDAAALSKLTVLDLRDSKVTDLSVLEECTKLTHLDLRGNELKPEQIEHLKSVLPECEILWSVPIAGEYYDSSTKKLALSGKTYEEIENIRYLEDLILCDLRGCTDLPGDKMSEICAQLPDAQIIWEIAVGWSHVLSNATELEWSSSYGSDLSPLKYCYQLKSLEFTSRTRDGFDLSSLKEVKTLESIVISFCNPKDFTPLSQLTNLKELKLYDTDFNDLSLLSGLTNLETLSVGVYFGYDERFDDLGALSALAKMKSLSIFGLGIKDISALGGMTSLESLNLENNPIEDFSVVCKMTQLKSLDITNTCVKDLSFLESLTQLNTLYMGGTDKDIAKYGFAAPSLGGFKAEDLSPVSKLTNLELLDICHTDLSDISFVTPLQKLYFLGLSDNKIKDASPVTELQRLEQLDIYGNKLSSSHQKELKKQMPNTVIIFKQSDLF